MPTIEIEACKAFRETGLDEGKAMEAALAIASQDAAIERALCELKATLVISEAHQNERFAKVDARFARIEADLLLLNWQNGFLTGLML